jgi:PhzF family phenazine biosynthesis protein
VRRPLVEVDVFGAEPYSGNPLAVVLDGEGLSADRMQRFARWTNLAETTFVLSPTRPEADYQVRIFTPTQELPFAGHPTLGTCHAWLEHRGLLERKDTIVQQCTGGLVSIRRSGARLAFAAPPPVRDGPVDNELLDHVAHVLGIESAEIVDAQWVDNGPGWLGVLLRDADAVFNLRPNVDRFVGVVGPYPDGSPCAFEVRAFLPGNGVTVEDPVTGSLNASLAQWLLGSGRSHAPYVVSQGAAVGARGRVYIDTDPDGAVWVGGATVTTITGEVDL